MSGTAVGSRPEQAGERQTKQTKRNHIIIQRHILSHTVTYQLVWYFKDTPPCYNVCPLDTKLWAWNWKLRWSARPKHQIFFFSFRCLSKFWWYRKNAMLPSHGTILAWKPVVTWNYWSTDGTIWQWRSYSNITYITWENSSEGGEVVSLDMDMVRDQGWVVRRSDRWRWWLVRPVVENPPRCRNSSWRRRVELSRQFLLTLIDSYCIYLIEISWNILKIQLNMIEHSLNWIELYPVTLKLSKFQWVSERLFQSP